MKPVKILPGVRYEFLCLSPVMLGFDVHFANKRTKVCTAQLGECAFDHAANKPRWTGYLAVRTAQNWKPYLLAVTEGAAQNCPQLVTQNGSHRGKVLHVARMGESKTAPLTIKVYPAPFNLIVRGPMEEIDLRAALGRLWGTNALTDDAPEASSSIPLP